VSFNDDPGYPAYEALKGVLDQAEKVIGEAGQPRAFLVILDIEAEGSTDEQRVVELYVLGNMPVEMVESVVPMAVDRYLKEQADAGSRSG
jgi:hypothetical protein